MIRKHRGQSTKEEIKNQMIQVENEQVEEPELIYDGENTLIKIGSDRYNTFLNLL